MTRLRGCIGVGEYICFWLDMCGIWRARDSVGLVEAGNTSICAKQRRESMVVDDSPRGLPRHFCFDFGTPLREC